MLLKIRKNTSQCMSNKNMLEIETKKLTISLSVLYKDETETERKNSR